MKLDPRLSNDGMYHQYCAGCLAETVERTNENGMTYYNCSSCGQRHDRSIVLDPAIKSWVAKDRVYWHESSGIFVRNLSGKFLFFERTIFPFQMTVPAGHVDSGEEALTAAHRELLEEVGISGVTLHHIANEDITGDSCRRGADDHRWHAYLAILDHESDVKLADEGRKPIWLTLDEAQEKELILPVKYVINKFRHELTGNFSS